MKPSQRQIEIQKKKLRAIIENDANSNTATRVAQVAEHVLRWATEDTRGWTKPDQEALLIADWITKGK